MSDIIKPDDLVDKATIDRLEKLYKTIIDVKGGLDESLTSVRNYLATWQAVDAKSIKELNSALLESEKIQKQIVQVSKEEVKVNIELEKYKQQQIKTSKAQAAETKKAADATNNAAKQLRELKKELQNIDPKKDPARFEAIAKQAGKLKDQISDANDAIKVFSKESKAAQAKTLFSQIGSDLADMDFAGAADKAKQFAGVIRSMTFAEVVGGIKAFGAAILDVGKALLFNPFVLVATSLVALGFAIKEVYDSFQEADKINAKYTAGLKEVEARTRSLKEETKELIIEQRVLRGEISKQEGERLKGAEKFKNEYVKIKAEEFGKLSALERDYAKTNESNITETALGTYGGIQLNAKRRAFNLKKQLDAEKEIRKAYGDEIANLNSKYIEELKKSRVEEKIDETKSNEKAFEDYKKLIKKQEDFNEQISEQRRANDLSTGEARTKRMMEQQEQGEKDQLKRLEDAEKLAKLQLEWDEQIAEQRRENDKKAQKEQDTLEKERRERVFKAIEESLKRAEDLRKFYIDREISQREKAIDRQERLAERGLENTLEFEKGALAQAELAKEQQKRKELRRQKGLTYLKLVAAYADKGDTNATRKALVDIALSELVSGSFYEGTKGKNVAEDLGSPVLPGKDGYLIRADGQEKIFNPEHSKMIGGMSNEDVAILAKSYQDGMLPQYATDMGGSFAQNVSNSMLVHQLVNVTKKLDEVKRTIQNKREVHTNIDNAGNVITTDIENGFRTVTKKLRRKPRI